MITGLFTLLTVSGILLIFMPIPALTFAATWTILGLFHDTNRINVALLLASILMMLVFTIRCLIQVAS